MAQEDWKYDGFQRFECNNNILSKERLPSQFLWEHNSQTGRVFVWRSLFHWIFILW